MVKKYNVKVNGKSYEVEVEEVSPVFVAQKEVDQNHKAESLSNQVAPSTTNEEKPLSSISKNEPKEETLNNTASQSNIDAPMSGLVIDVKVKKGDRVKPGDKLLVLEAMKMENDIVSDITGIIDEINCKKGDNVETGETLIKIS